MENQILIVILNDKMSSSDIIEAMEEIKAIPGVDLVKTQEWILSKLSEELP